MTRQEYDSRFAATLGDTDRFAAAELDEINDAVFALVSDVDVDADNVDQDVGHASGDVFNAWTDGATADDLVASVRAARATLAASMP